MTNVESRVAAVFRRNKAIEPRGNTVIEADDEVFFVAAKGHIKKVMSELRRTEDSYKRVIIAGGGNIGYRLSKTLEKDYRIKLIEHNEERATFLSENLSSTVVLHGSATDKSLLEEENIENTDVFAATRLSTLGR